jgi:transcription-repair coupling factor (superfamily II helicase)
MNLDTLLQDLAATLPEISPGGALGLRRSARLPALAVLHGRLNQPLLLLTDRLDHALTLLDELGYWLPATPRLLFPEPTPLFYENAAWGEATRRDRLVALTLLAGYHIPGIPALPLAPVIVAPARAVMTRTLPRREFLKAARSLKPGGSARPDELARACLNLGYENSNIVIGAGQFARRGGIFDIWPPASPQPVRVEFFGDEIETLRRFDPATQRTQAAIERLLITPAREFLTPEGQPTGSDAEPLSEFDLPRLYSERASLLDYLPRQALVLLDDRQALQDAVGEVEQQAVEMRRDLIKDGILAEDYPSPYLTWDELDDSLAVHPHLELGPSGGVDEPAEAAGAGSPALSTRFQAAPRFAGRLKPLMQYIEEGLNRGETVLIVSRQAPRLRELWVEQAGERALPAPALIDGSLAEGWRYEPVEGAPVHLLTDGEIFGWRRPEPRQRHRPIAESPEAAYADLQPGDYVVHVDHGIGRFVSLVERSMEGLLREYLCVEYANAAQLFVPVHQADRLTRYVGPDGRVPGLSNLGSAEWKSAKAHVKEAVQQVAEDLLELYARRSTVEGYNYQIDTPWQQELEASFPYIETDDQMRVIGEVKRDMEARRPMDRLICGDVGYGKTEVALRAAFKAVMDNKQVAVLVPTTVLAQQHHQTFSQRLAAFPVAVEMLSRFRTPQQQKEIVDRLGQGGVDIIIGTHRLLSNDVRFKDLGLLIIDEEQRFGVTHKETLKKMRTEVDVLTLTATPIPRTLYMALTGVRDISTINTPPEERLPVVTHVGPYSQRLVRQATLRELERGGQVFFVHNRVQTIGAMRLHMEKLVPEARLAVAHGQMAEGELAGRMEQFANGEVDVLLCTSIIESGLDIPNANTLIVDRADTFGLAQLYQLRGRVGRGAQRAYAYFFRHNKKAPTPDGRQRLETIAENSQLGAGFSIAMRDLEIRGSGDILGTRQSGNIAAVGFHLYTRLLAEAVRRMRLSGRGSETMPRLPGGEAALTSPVNVDLPLPTSIPASYVADKSMRLRLYRRLADVQTLAEADALAEEFADRFGPPPAALNNLLLQLKLKILAEKAGLASITAEGGQFALRYPEGLMPSPLPDPGPLVRVGKTALWMPFSQLDNWPARLVEAVQRLEGSGHLAQPDGAA